MYPGVELRLYRYVAVLAEELSFTHAAAKLHAAQPNLTRSIRQLEQYLGLKLFDRKKGRQRVTLTAAGEAFTAEARLTLFHADRAVQGARAAKGQYRGPWSIGYSPLIDFRILSKVRRHLSLIHPAADVRLISAHTSEQADGLVRGTLHAGLVILPIREQALTSEGLYREALVLALPNDHPLAIKDTVQITDLDEIPLVTMRGDIEPRFGEDLNRIFRLARVRLRIAQQATTQAEVLELVLESGFLAGLIMPWAQHPARDGIVFRRLVDEFLTAEVGLAYLRENGSAILKSLRKFLIEVFQPLSPESEGPERRARQMALF
jgi:DNA-binding transcriptional LysR family regulator